MKGCIDKLFETIKRLPSGLRFLILLVTLACIYDYPSIVLKRPQSIHRWRQSDNASMALNYYQNGMHFFQPQTHNLTSDNNTSCYNAPSETPVSHYFIAVLYKIFGPHDFIYRLVNTLIFLAGIYFLYRTLLLLSGSFYWSSLFALLFFTSPVLVYYGNNFLTEAPALSFSFIAWYFFSVYLKGRGKKYYFLSMLFFLLTGLYKLTALISLVALLIIFFIEISGIGRPKDDRKIFPYPLLQIFPFIIIGILVGGWVIYAKYFNDLHKTGYFSTWTLPIWQCDKVMIDTICNSIRNTWYNQYFHPLVYYLMGGIFLANLIFYRKASKFYLSVTVLLLLGSIIYVLLWFISLHEHDYYVIVLYILLAFNVFTLVDWISKTYPGILASKYLKIIFFIFLIYNIAQARNRTDERYNGWMNDHPIYKDYDNITPYLRSLGIKPLDTVICLPDFSHCTLYLMNVRGWTGFCHGNSDSSALAISIQRGAKYLIINGEETFGKPYLQSFLKYPLGTYNKVSIFKLSEQLLLTDSIPAVTSYRKEVISCGAERLSSDGNMFLADSSNVLLSNGTTQTTEKVYQGKYAVKVFNNDQYAMAVKLTKIIPGQRIIAQVYRYSPQKIGYLVASSPDINEFYVNQPTHIEQMPNGWERLTLEFTVHFRLKDDLLSIYLWNPNKTPVYFDNLTIIREKM